MSERPEIQALCRQFFWNGALAKLNFAACLALTAAQQGFGTAFWGLAMGFMAYMAGRNDAHLWVLGKVK